jgi:hypothetical protein
MNNKSILLERTTKYFLIIFIILFVGLLTIYGIKGIYSRYAQDDYCYGYHLRTFGFWNMQVSSYFNQAEYNSNRYSLTFAHSLAELLGGSRFVPFLPILEIIAWVASLWYLIRQVLIGRPSRHLKSVVALAALGIIFYTFYLAGNLYQILFWLSAMQTYLTPMVISTFIFGRLLALTRSSPLKTFQFIEIALLCLFVGGFSETTTLWLFVCLWLILIGIFLMRKQFPDAGNGFRLVATAIIATGIALVILAVCPANQYRAGDWTRPDLPTLIRMSLFYGEEFIRVTIKSTPLPFMVVTGLGFWLGSLVIPDEQRKPKFYLFGLLIAVVILYILSVTTMVPTMYAMSSYPGDRALLPAHFSLLSFLAVVGWLCSRLMFSIWPKIAENIIFKSAFFIFGFMLFAYTARTVSRVYDKMPLYQARAQGWDLRDQMILDAKADGQTNITVPQFDSIYGITEIKPDPINWVNFCAARYYGVDSITAEEDYLGVPVYPIGK